MEATHIGFFAFPTEHTGELTRLDHKWRDAFNQEKVDFPLHENEMFLTARSVAVHRVECDGAGVWDIFVDVTGFFCQACWRGQDSGQNVFSAEETGRFAEAVAELVERRGMDKLVKAIARRSYDKPEPEKIVAMYQTFRDVLSFAAENGLGLALAAFNENAEAEMAAKRRRQEQRRQESEARGREPAPPPRTVSPLKDYIEREHLRQFYREEARRNLDEPLWLAAVPDDRLSEIVPLLRMMSLVSLEVEEELPRDMSPYQYLEQTGVLARRARELCQAYQILDRHAVARAKLTKGGEDSILGQLDNALLEWDNAQDSPSRLNRPQHSAAAAALYASLCAWEADKGGERAAVATLIDDTEVSLRMARRAYRAAKDVLRAASEHGCGFVPMYLDADAGEASRP